MRRRFAIRQYALSGSADIDVIPQQEVPSKEAADHNACQAHRMDRRTDEEVEMVARSLSPVPLTVVALVCALAGGSFTTRAVAAPAAAKGEAVRAFALTTGMANGKMMFLDAQGKANPRLIANLGDTVEITVSSGEGAEHDIVIPELHVHSKHFSASTGPTTVRFKVGQAGTFTYICSIDGHRQIGMEGTLEVKGNAAVAALDPTQVPEAGDDPRRTTKKRAS
jgi:plastocyanin